MALSVLRRDAFEKLLDALAPDRVEAGLAYEEVRRRLIRFFGWEGCQRPEDCGDEVFNRVGSKLAGGERILNIMAYASGVSRLVLKEAIREQSREQSRLVLEFPAPKPADVERAEERCLDRCLDELPAESRELLLEYYRGDSADRLRNRKVQTEKLGITLNSLRNQALRLREKLEDTLQGCVDGEGGRDTSNVANIEVDDA